ncbi:carbamoyltransferase HypF [Shewanella marina]|uniref:carbamoyltransferase HypF n=1 Tax=Shewanella marina TaxID=487319 RepID=UPI000472AC6E|nr:carbamoyltransferase HypF [Shewanella marina]
MQDTSPNHNTELKRVRLIVNGIVQGVGFRPFIYRLACEFNLTGFVLNNPQGVIVEFQGQTEALDSCLQALPLQLPPLARVDHIEQQCLAVIDTETDFSIHASSHSQQAIAVISTDKSCCQDCVNDINHPQSRFFGYPFTNCTNCGPRYTIINSLPYDRPATAMADFMMCSECQAAYDNPLDRRYHAQPISCPNCGPQLRLLTATGELVANKEAALSQTVNAIKQGKIVAIKGLGGFHLVCDASNNQAVALLRQRKHRPHKPLAIMVADVKQAKQYAQATDNEWKLLASQERPIVLLNKSNQCDTLLSEHVAPNINKIGIFLPYTPLHQLLFNQLDCPIVATSANISGEPIIAASEQIISKLGSVVDLILDHNRPIINPCDDSLVQLIDDELLVIRLARGYAPLTLPLVQKLPKTYLAVGAQQKNTVALGFDKQLLISPYIGDLFTIGSEQRFQQTITLLQELYQLQAEQVISDCHPDYFSSQFAQSQGVANQQVQHHYAHVLAVMAMQQYRDNVIGISFDGTGLGDDGTLWGGEALLADVHGYQRLAHLTPFKLIGRQQAIKEPLRIVLSLLLQHYSLAEIEQLQLSCFKQVPKLKLTQLTQLWQLPQCISSSSMGRVFDAVAVLLGLIEQNQFEGQAGMLLAQAAYQADSPYSFELTLVNDQWQLHRLFKQIVDIVSSQPLTDTVIANIAAGFMQAIAHAVVTLAQQHAELPIVLCGGVLQNEYLLSCCNQQLKQAGINRLYQQTLPLNDSSIALGQLWYSIHN